MAEAAGEGEESAGEEEGAAGIGGADRAVGDGDGEAAFDGVDERQLGVEPEEGVGGVEEAGEEGGAHVAGREARDEEDYEAGAEGAGEDGEGDHRIERLDAYPGEGLEEGDVQRVTGGVRVVGGEVEALDAEGELDGVVVPEAAGSEGEAEEEGEGGYGQGRTTPDVPPAQILRFAQDDKS